MTMNQRRLLPSTSMLAAFEAAARTSSFSAAARELDLTQGAISRQIRALENQLGVELFVRDRQQVHLSDIGATYGEEIRSALGTIRQATLSAIANPGGGVLDLAILPTFGTRWLIPRLPSFLEANPGVTVNFAMRVSPFDFERDRQHAAIHYGAAQWPDADCTFLMDEEVVPVFSPALAEKFPLSQPKDFTGVALLHLTTRPNAWADWFAAFNVPKQEPQGMFFEQFSSVAQAAAAGMGAALLPTFLIESELKSGALVPLNGGAINSSSAYYLVTPKTRAGYAPMLAFRSWLLKTIELYNNK